jgi:HEPN domain-containing protein
MSDSIIKEWLKKAEEDYSTAHILFLKKKNPSIMGFHCQQSIEKYLKAFLLKNKENIIKTHDLIDILDKAIKFDQNLKVYKQ